MRPPRTVARRMGVAWLIGFLMMDAMRGDPGDRTAFECQTCRKPQKSTRADRGTW